LLKPLENNANFQKLEAEFDSVIISGTAADPAANPAAKQHKRRTLQTPHSPKHATYKSTIYNTIKQRVLSKTPSNFGSGRIGLRVENLRRTANITAELLLEGKELLLVVVKRLVFLSCLL
jgi:hypothetical protein